MIVPEAGDKDFTQELDVLQLDLGDQDFVDFLVEWGSESPLSDSTEETSSANAYIETEQETEPKARRGRRKNVMVASDSNDNGQPRKRPKKSPKQPHPSIGDGISVVSSSSGLDNEITETAECSAHMAAAGT